MIGRAIIAETELKEVARFTANLSVQDVSEVRQASLQLISTQMQFQATATQYMS